MGDLHTGRRAAPSAPFALVDAAGRLQGPPAGRVLHPPLGNALEQLGAAIRYHLTVPTRTREMVILMVGHHDRAPFELYAHTKAGAAAGLSPADLDALTAGRPPELTSSEERLAHHAPGRSWTPARSTRTYCFALVRSADHCALVDTAFADEAVHRRLTAKYGRAEWAAPVHVLDRIGVAAAQVDTVILTRNHFDHAGCVRAFPNAHIYIQEREIRQYQAALQRPPGSST